MKSAGIGPTQALKVEERPDERLVYGVVYVPNQVDSEWETMLADDVRKMAHDFLALAMTQQIDVRHDKQPCGAVVVESFIARKGDAEYPEGAWVLGTRLPEGDLWEQAKKGELNGYSFHAAVERVPKQVLVDLVKIASGDTYMNSDTEALPPHTHKYYVEFNNMGKVSLGMTDEILGHKHKIEGTVVTEAETGHTHRYAVV